MRAALHPLPAGRPAAPPQRWWRGLLAALALMLACGAEMDEAVRMANRAAGIVVGKLGTAVVTYAELFN